MRAMCLYAFFYFANFIFLSSGNRLKAIENLFRGEIFFLREELVSVVKKQDFIMKTLNETIEKFDITAVYPDKQKDGTNKAPVQQGEETEHPYEDMNEVSEELLRLKRGLHEEKKARKADNKVLSQILENKITDKMMSKIDMIINNSASTQETLRELTVKVNTIEQKLDKDILHELTAKVNTIEQKLDNLEKLQKTELKQSLESINTAILENNMQTEDSLSKISNTHAAVNLFKETYMSALQRYFSTDHFSQIPLQECFSSDTDISNKSKESCLAENSEDLVHLFLPSIRLAGSTRFYEGRVEVFHNGSYGTICDDDWDDTDAQVACRMLGYTTGIGYIASKHTFGQGDGKIILDNVACSGEETSLFECWHQGIGNHNCGHDEDAGVRCS